MQSEDGISREDAQRRIFAIDIDGLLLAGMKADDYQKSFLQPREVIADWPVPKHRAPNLEEVVSNSGATTLIGLSAQAGAFTRPLLKELSSHTERPIVFALSNPTSRSETLPEDVMEATGGRALMASGSPFPAVSGAGGRKVHISQCNNLYVFPGMGLGAVISQATRVSSGMFAAASRAISEMVSDSERSEGHLLPPLDSVREVSFQVAMAAAKQARDEGMAMRVPDDRLGELIRNAMWVPRYYPYRRTRGW